ncbi:MAG TPA: hypothetical protein VKF59_11035, partial [Candidatus Dormibacteraeota bacterium]|nr:hypothetical protein [Candidatus Dormibacteraeota bacterium]
MQSRSNGSGSSPGVTTGTPADGASTRRVPPPEIDVVASRDLGAVLREVVAERLRQDRRWGRQNQP